MRTLLSVIFLFVFVGLQAQTYNSVKIDLSEKPIIELAKLGLDVAHGEYAKGKHFVGVFSNKEIGEISQAGFEYEILIENLSDYRRSHYHNHGITEHSTFRNPGPCDDGGSSDSDIEVPENFELGSFLGFFTYQEMLDNLDEMVALYPDLISVRSPIDTILTHEGRPIFWVKISDNPNTDETDEPEILYTAVHHAREPGGMSGLIYFMWHTLENYATDPQIQAMVNETELYIVPCLNPDGYIFNEENYLNGGNIFWRKNRRDNGDGTYGVDLNRNYGYEFGFDNNGSSPNTDAATYRGPEGFSEPETFASQTFCNAHEFKIALNYHTFGNLLIYPWGYDNIGVADPMFLLLANSMTAENDFFPGTGFETVGYPANGNSDDWMYGENVSKPAIYSMTPELGLGGFYPDEDNILGIVQSALPQNITTSLLAHSYALIEDKNELLISSINPQEFNFKLTNAGLEDGDFTVSISGVSDNFDGVGGAKDFNITSQGTVEDFISFNLKNDIQGGEEVVFALAVDNGSYVISDTITKIFGMTEVLFSDAANNLDNWTADEWATTTEEFVSSSTSFTDSPNSNYDANIAKYIFTEDISLVDVEAAFLSFWAKWEIEAGYDYTQVSISTNGGINYEPQCGQYTTSGSNNQDFNQPLYDGNQLEWVKETIDLSDYLGENIRIRFSMVSDGGVERDGFYFDDLELETISENTTSSELIDLSSMQVRTYPNPADGSLFLELSNLIPQTKLAFYNAQGTLVYENEFNNETVMKISVSDWASGMYFYELLDRNTGGKSSGKVFVK